MPGVGKVMEAKLGALGLRTVADLRAFESAALEARFGRWGRRLHELSLGIDEHVVVSERPTQQISAEDTFADDVPIEATAPMIEALAQRVWRAAEREPDRVARTVVLKLKTREFRLLTRSLTPPLAPADAESLTRIALALRERVGLPARTRYRLVGVGLGGFVDRHDALVQPELFSMG
jgi:DNA polymerase-4